jgi:glucose/arabinose dehydrogenase
MRTASTPRRVSITHRFAVTFLAASGIGAALLLPAVAHAAGPLVHDAGDHCAGIKGGSSTAGEVVQTQTCSGAAYQQWTLTSAGELRTLGGTRCLDAKGNGSVPRTPVIAYDCQGGTNQKWRLNADGSIVGVHSGLCLVPADGNTAAGVPLELRTCSGLAGQRWITTGVGNVTTVDGQAPSVPTGLALGSLACRSAVLSWQASTDNVGVAGYDVYHDGQRMTSVAGNVRSATLVLTPGARWGLYVNARDAAGNVSQASATLAVTVPACSTDTQRPTIPTQLKGTVSGTTATLTWAASSDNVAVTGYDVIRNGTKVATTPNLQHTDAGLTASTAYTYRVAARDAAGNVSDTSLSVSLTTAGGCTNVVCGTVQLTTDKDIPWGLVALPDGSILYTRRDAQNIVRVDSAGVRTNVGKVPDVVGSNGEGGLLGLAVTKSFPATDPWLYIYHTTATDNRIVRIQYRTGVLDTSTRQVLLSGIARNKYHNGGRLRFGPDGKLYATAGDGQNENAAQNVNSLAGKVLRINPDGTIPSDNPFQNAVWSYGHRNPQGIAFDSQGRLWEQEFGNSLLDETNLIVKGGNYGWPYCEGTVMHVGTGCSTAGIIAPKYTYRTDEGSCSGIAIVRDSLYVACARGARLYRAVISGAELTNVQQLFVGTYGRLRTVEPAIDGGLWLTTTTLGDKDDIVDNSNEKVLKIQLGQ